MLSSFRKAILQIPVGLQFHYNLKEAKILTSLYSTFTARDFIVDKSHGESGTLTTRFVKHIALQNCKSDPLIPQKIKYSEYYPIHDFRGFNQLLKETKTDQLPRLIVFTYTYKTNCDPHKFSDVLNQIDVTCLKRLKSMSCDEILSILYAFMYLIPNKITKLEFYQNSLRKLVTEFQDDYSQEKFVQICFYLGLWKKNKQSSELMKYLVNKYLEQYINNVNRMDFTIISNSLFKTSVVCDKIAFKERLIKEVLACDENDAGILITFIKALRLNRVHSDEIFDKLKSMLTSSELKSFQFKGLVHILAYFADNLNNDPEVCSALINESLERLDSMGNDDQFINNDMRAKDLATLLWSCSYLSTGDIIQNDIEFLHEIILHKLNNNEYRYSPDELIDTTLSLWMLGYQSQDLLQAVLKIPQNLNQQRQDRVKLDSRLKLLLSCVDIEQPKWVARNRKQMKSFNESQLAPEYLVEKQNALQNVYKTLQNNKEELELKSIQFTKPIESLNIAGLLVEMQDERKFYVEVLEENQILKYDHKPSAFVALKIRLLKHLGYQVMVIYPNLKDDEVLSTVRDLLDDVPEKLNVNNIAS